MYCLFNLKGYSDNLDSIDFCKIYCRFCDFIYYESSNKFYIGVMLNTEYKQFEAVNFSLDLYHVFLYDFNDLLNKKISFIDFIKLGISFE